MGDDVAERVLDAAARRFVAVGVTKTTMAEIAAEAGLAKPTLYKRFPDKPAVVAALVRRETDAFGARVRAAAAREPDAAEGLLAAFGTAVRWLDRHPFLRKSLDVEPHLLLPLLTEPDGPVVVAGVGVFRDLVRDGVARGDLRRCSVPLVAEAWWRLVLSFVLTPAAGTRRREGGELRALAREALLEGLLPARRTKGAA